MPLSRRNFMGVLGAGAAGAGLLGLPGARLLGADVITPPSSGPILLNSNENAYGASPRSMAAMREALSACNRYPDDGDLVAALADFHGVGRENIVVGCGSTEVLRMAAQVCTGRKVITALPTFEALRHYAHACGCDVVEVPLAQDYSHDLEAMLSRVDGDTALVYICNPNNPTASITQAEEIKTFLDKLPPGVQVLIDEAYHHFAAGAPGYGSFLARAAMDERLIALRTFSKVYGMAGLRLGYGVASPSVARKLRGAAALDNINLLGLAAALAGLEDDHFVASSTVRNAAERAEFVKQASARSLPVIPSYANFVMLDAGIPVKRVIAHFRENGVLVGRPFPPLQNHVRVSLGLSEEMREFWRVWDKLPKSDRAMARMN